MVGCFCWVSAEALAIAVMPSITSASSAPSRHDSSKNSKIVQVGSEQSEVASGAPEMLTRRDDQMEAYRIKRFGSVDRIVLRSSEGPRPGPKEILMRVRASALNYRDLMVLKGGGRGPTKIGVVPLSDGAGEVAAIGEGVTRVKICDRIAGTFHPRWFGGP